ncbi:hypothetical protein [Haliangium sp.]|uniref:hypothetical protein n=1 Tax=Haliangium sp. TaxID=2663208 RepID=UPI003D0FED37
MQTSFDSAPALAETGGIGVRGRHAGARRSLSRLGPGWLAAALVLVGVALGAGPARAQLFSPGPLHQVHGELEGDDHCTDCHSRGRRIAQDRCLECHDDLGRRIQARGGLHGRAYRGQRCSKCHIEHLGKNSRLVRWPGGQRENLDHSQTGWELRGSHQRTGCDDCHDKRNRRGNRTYLGLSTTCNSCHQDPHKGRFGRTCNDCHKETDWKKDVRLDDFNHDQARFELRGKHRSVDCDKCHGKPRKYRGLAFTSCDDCHEDPHKGRFKQACDSCHSVEDWKQVEGLRENHPGTKLINGHRRVPCADCHDRGNSQVPSKGRRCVGCHPVVHKARFGNDCKDCHASIRWLGLPERIGRRNHRRTRYPLRGQHREVACDKCHSTKLPSARRFRGVEFDRCDRCHADRHEGRFSARSGGECGQCHTVDGYLPTRFDLEQHRTTRFPLDGRHRAVPCSGCHTGSRPRLDMSISDRSCAGCHQNPHGEQFAAEMQLGGCAHCHSTAGWQNPKVDHSTWPLTGAHSMAKCSSCHTPSEADRAAGGGTTYRGVPRQCEGCHRDEHAGQFRLSEPVRPCDDCHVTDAFRIPTFEHEARTGYALVGKHAEVACVRCHPKQRIRDGDSVRRYRLGYNQCRDCHANPHRE